MILRPHRPTLFPYTTLFRSDSWTTVDINIGYRAAGGPGWLANTQANFGIVNVFDQRPPFVNRFDLTSGDRKSTRLNSSHVEISYAVFCLKKKRIHAQPPLHR